MKRLIKYFKSFYSKEFSPQDILKSKHKRSAISEQKEVTEVENFKYLLGFYNDVTINYSILNQNINTSVFCFSKNIWTTLDTLKSITEALSDPTEQATKRIYSLAKSFNLSFLFFCEKGDEVFEEKHLKDLVHYMTVILDYFEQNKTSEDLKVSKFCSAIFWQLEVFYCFYFYLLCYLKNIDTSELGSVVFYKEF